MRAKSNLNVLVQCRVTVRRKGIQLHWRICCHFDPGNVVLFSLSDVFAAFQIGSRTRANIVEGQTGCTLARPHTTQYRRQRVHCVPNGRKQVVFEGLLGHQREQHDNGTVQTAFTAEAGTCIPW